MSNSLKATKPNRGNLRRQQQHQTQAWTKTDAAATKKKKEGISSSKTKTNIQTDGLMAGVWKTIFYTYKWRGLDGWIVDCCLKEETSPVATLCVW